MTASTSSAETMLKVCRDERHWNGCSLSDLARRYGTPLFVVNPACLRRAYAVVARAFQQAGLQARLFFSVKTNPLPEVVRTLHACGAGLEIVAPHELWLAEEMGCPPERIIVNGTVKPPALLRKAVQAGVHLINIEGEEELAVLQRIARALGRPARVGIRLNPAFRSWRFDPTVSTAARSSPIGFSLQEDRWVAALRTVWGDPLLEFGGLHFHLGSGIQRVKPYDRALRRILRAVDPLVAGGLPLPAIDIGGGFSLATVREASAWEALRLFGWGRGLAPPPAREEGALVRAVARCYARRLRDFADAHRIPMPSIVVEPGRALCGSAQMLLLTVQRVVHADRGASVAFCDGGAMSLGPLLLAEYHDVVTAQVGKRPERRYRLVGNLPTPMDVAAPDVRLPELEPGTVVGIKDVGAYFTSLGNTFAGPRPAVVAVERGQAQLVRRRETWADLVARDRTFAGSGH